MGILTEAVGLVHHPKLASWLLEALFTYLVGTQQRRHM